MVFFIVKEMAPRYKKYSRFALAALLAFAFIAAKSPFLHHHSGFESEKNCVVCFAGSVSGVTPAVVLSIPILPFVCTEIATIVESYPENWVKFHFSSRSPP